MDDRNFTPREIEYFATVRLHGTTTKAADARDVTRPAVSRTLPLLAGQAGFQLFRKRRQRLVPTPEAHMPCAEVQRVFESARAISRAAREIRVQRSGRLNIAALPAFGPTLPPSLAAEFAHRHPTVAIAPDIRSPTTVIRRAISNQLDIGIATTATEDNPSVARRALVDTEPVCVLPAGHPLAARGVVTPEDLHGMDAVTMGSGDPMRRQLDALCEAREVRRNPKVEPALDRLSAWMARDKGIVIRRFLPAQDLKLSVCRPWGVIASTASDAFRDALIQGTRACMKPTPA